MYDGEKHVSPISLPNLADRTILLGGFSKNYAMTGWRLGYGVYPNQELIQGVSQLITNCHSCTNQFIQYGGIAALEGSHAETNSMVKTFEKRRNLIIQLLEEIGLPYIKPKGAFYILFDVRQLGVESSKFVLDLLYSHNTCALDAACFGSTGKGFVRLSYATSEENIRKGLAAIKKLVEEIKACTVKIKPVVNPLEKNLSDIGFMTAMTSVLMCNYANTGHFGGPMSYTPANVVVHLGGKPYGGLIYDIRNPKKPLTDRFMLTGGHCIPTCYALWMILYQAMESQFKETLDKKYYCDPNIAILPVDIIGFRRSPQAVATILKENNLEDELIFIQAKQRGIRALMGHSETTDVTNDVNGGPSGIGVSTTAGKAMFWDKVGASPNLKVIAFEGEFAFTEGHAQELKTIALAQQVGKRLRLFVSFNNAGIDDSLIGGVVPDNQGYHIGQQFESYGWKVYYLEDGSNYRDLLETFKQLDEHPFEDKRPLVIIGKTVKVGGLKINQITGHKSHPFGFGTNGDYVLELMKTFEDRFGVTFDKTKPNDERQRLLQCKYNLDQVMSILERNNGYLRKWIANRLINIADQIPRSDNLIIPKKNTFNSAKLEPKAILEQTEYKLIGPVGLKKGARRAISELGKYINKVTGDRWVTIAADLSGSINVENASLSGHYHPINNPQGSRLKAGIQECANASTVCGLVSQSLDNETHVGFHGVTGTYGAFTPLFYTPIRVFSQQNQDSPIPLGVVTVIAGHSGPETAADARTHFGIFAPQVWNLFPKNQIINLYCWDYNDVAPAYLAALEKANKVKNIGIIVLHVARPDHPIFDRKLFHHNYPLAATRGCYLIQNYRSLLEKEEPFYYMSFYPKFLKNLGTNKKLQY